jgi:putative sterol carrier protein
MAQRSRDVMRGVIAGKPDDDVMQLVENMGGVETVLEMCFQGMEEALDPTKAQDCVIGWGLTSGGKTYDYTVTVKDKKATYEECKAADARVTLGCSVTEFVRLIAGEVDGMAEFMAGKLKIDGDIMFAQQIPQMFGIA